MGGYEPGKPTVNISCMQTTSAYHRLAYLEHLLAHCCRVATSHSVYMHQWPVVAGPLLETQRSVDLLGFDCVQKDWLMTAALSMTLHQPRFGPQDGFCGLSSACNVCQSR